MSHQIKAVVFDWAGTMVDFGCMAPVGALITAFAAEGVTIAATDARRDMGMAKRDHVWALLSHGPVSHAWAAAKGRPADENDRDRLHDALGPLMTRSAEQCAVLIPGAAELVARLREKSIRIGSCTGYTREMMSAVLPRAAAQGYAPEVTVCAGETPAGRPSPLMLWKVLVELGVWPAHACIKVDDAPVGMAEGRAAGCWTVGVAASGNCVGLTLEEFADLAEPDRAARVAAARRDLEAAGADFVIDTVAQLDELVEDIGRRIQAGDRPAPAA